MLCIACALAGCTSDSLTESRPRSNTVEQFVTGNAARGLDASGHFVLATSSGGPLSELTLARAEGYAHAFATELGPDLSDYLVQGHGGPINFDRLRVCRQSVYAASSFEPADSTMPTFVRGEFGGWWLVALCEDDAVEISVAVEAIGTGLTLTDGRTGFLPDSNGGHFFAVGVPSWWDGPVPVSAEQAVVLAGLATGRRIDEVPQLIAPSHLRGPPQVAVWQMSLDTAVFFRGTGTEGGILSRHFYAGLLVCCSATLRPTLAIPLPAQPTIEVLNEPFGAITLMINPVRPIYFEAATAVRASQ